MRCRSCNDILNRDEEELTFEFGENVELCVTCLEDTGINIMPENFEDEYE